MEILNAVNDILWTYILIGLLLGTAVYFTVRTRGVQFRKFQSMVRLLGERDDTHDAHKPHERVSSFQAFAVSIASRVGTGNLAGVATAIAVGGPGAIFWMWVIALLGSASAFVEATLAQLFKIKNPQGGFRGGPAYYIQKGLGCRWWAVLFAVLITVTFGLAFNSVQANTITAAAFNAMGWPVWATGIPITVLSLLVICGGIHRISRFSEIVVPGMAVLYLLLALVILAMNITNIPAVFAMIIEGAFSGSAAAGGGIGAALMMGVKRGLFSNEAGMGSAPNVAATACVSHPVKQGLVQTLSVFTDTLLVCTCTAIIILCSGLFADGASGIELTQDALTSEIGPVGRYFVAVAILLFAFTSIVANYYYGETNLRFIKDSKALVWAYRFVVGGAVLAGCVAELDTVWAAADLTMGLMALCNIIAILALGGLAVKLLKDYEAQRSRGLNPRYLRTTIPSRASQTDCWPER